MIELIMFGLTNLKGICVTKITGEYITFFSEKDHEKCFTISEEYRLYKTHIISRFSGVGWRFTLSKLNPITGKWITDWIPAKYHCEDTCPIQINRRPKSSKPIMFINEAIDLKTMEKMIKDWELKPKLFDKPKIVDFSTDVFPKITDYKLRLSDLNKEDMSKTLREMTLESKKQKVKPESKIK